MLKAKIIYLVFAHEVLRGCDRRHTRTLDVDLAAHVRRRVHRVFDDNVDGGMFGGGLPLDPDAALRLLPVEKWLCFFFALAAAAAAAAAAAFAAFARRSRTG